jgi:hypothetical protein
MREFAKATVKQVEEKFGLTRDKWPVQDPGITDTTIVRFFLEETEGMATFMYHAMCEVHNQLTEPVLFGDPAEIPREWLDEEKIQFYFHVSADEFSQPDFLKKHFA